MKLKAHCSSNIVRLLLLVVSFVLLLASAAAVSGCSNEGQGSSEVRESQQESSSRGGSTESVQSDVSANAETVADYKVTSARSFSDGLAVASLADIGTVVVHEDGTFYEIQDFEVDQISNYHDGTAIAIDGNSVASMPMSVIDEEGDVVLTVRDAAEKAAEQYLSDYEVTSVDTYSSVSKPYLGYIPVIFDIDSYEYSGMTVGILRADGTWAVPPGEPADWELFNWGSGYYSFGCNAFVFDCVTGEAIEIDTEETSVMDIVDTMYAIQGAIWDREQLARHDGLVFNKYGSEGACFEDADGNRVIDLSQYRLKNEPVFNDGYALLSISNDQGSPYITVIDKQGNQMFDPIRNPANSQFNKGYQSLSEGAFFLDGEHYTEGRFLDVFGNQVGSLIGREGTTFSNGLAWIQTEDGWVCIDLEGKPVFE